LNPNSKIKGVIVIGAGAAGLMTAIQARRLGADVLILDGQDKIGAKILISGGTRCNLTNQRVAEGDYETEEGKALRSILSAFSSEKAVQFFKELGVEVELEPGGKFFPTTHSGRTVLDALMKEISRSGIELKTGCKVKQCAFQKDISRFLVAGEGFSYEARTVVLATGGLSFPQTGSDGTGYGIARAFGHSLIPTSPSLTPLETDDSDWKALTGLSLPVRVAFWAGGKKRAAYEGDFLFTHTGFSGPAVLNISRHWIRAKGEEGAKVAINFLPLETEEGFREQLLKGTALSPSKPLKNFLAEHLPTRLAETLLKKLAIPPLSILNQLKKTDRENLLRSIFHFPLRVTGDLGYRKAEVTAGGIDLKEIDRATLESKLQPGLFFSGEILDVDGRIGGFNFQWAWSSGVVAARGVTKRLGEMPS